MGRLPWDVISTMDNTASVPTEVSKTQILRKNRKRHYNDHFHTKKDSGNPNKVKYESWLSRGVISRVEFLKKSKIG